MGIFAGLSILILIYRAWLDRAWHFWIAKIASPLGAALLAMFAWWLLSSLFAFDPERALSVWFRVAVACLLVVETARQFSMDSRLPQWFFRALILSALVTFIYVVCVSYYDSSWIYLLELARVRELNLIRVFKPTASVAACLIPLALWWGMRERGGWRWAAWLLVPVSLAVIYHNGVEISRAAVIGVVGSLLGVALCWLLIKLPGRIQVAMVCGGITVGLVLGAVFLQALPRLPFDGMQLPDLALPFPDLHRQVIWGFAYDLILQNPLVGVGIDASNLLPESRQEIALNLVEKVETVQMIGSHPHNWVLEVAAETGLPGLLLAVTVLIVLLRSVLQNASMGAARWAFTGMFFAFWVSSLANFSIWVGWWQACFLILAGVILAEARGNHRKNA